jgi:phosphoribosylanthranilate isomerase
MITDVEVKICGITDDESMDAAIEAGADYVGLVFYPASPRAVTPEQAALLTELIPEEILRVGLFVDADDATLDRVLTQVRLDLLQFHGSESPERIEAVRLEYGVPVMKVVAVATADDLAEAERYFAVADWLLFDAKPPKDATRPGGNAVSFDWAMMADRKWPLPWMLAGGLTPANVADAIRITGAKAVDVSSGVESAPGVKDTGKIHAFIEAAKGGKP